MFGAIFWVLFVGALGGCINALLGDDKGFVWPKTVQFNDTKVTHPGIIGNAAISAFAAFIWWALNGSLSNFNLVGEPGQQVNLTLATLGAAGLIGFGGARWLTDMNDIKLLKEAVSVAFQKGQQDSASESEAGLGFGTVSEPKSSVSTMSRQEIQNSTPMQIMDMLK